MIGELLGGRGGIATPTVQAGEVPPSLGNASSPPITGSRPSTRSKSRTTPKFTKRPPKPAPPSKNTSRFGFPK